MLLWLRHAVSDDIGDALEATIAPQPRSTRPMPSPLAKTVRAVRRTLLARPAGS
jgi:hypothetical protein